jgi:TetR/AcrR family transcriptional regulator, transcriptional repressor for nem operon
MVYEKGQRTRERIVRRTGALLNTHGYAGITVDDILAAARLTKGGFYRHFADKEAAAFEGYRFNLRTLAEARAQAVCGVAAPLERLRRMITFGLELAMKPPLKGGCPILNLAIESDDTHPKHRREARKAMDAWRAELASAGRAARDAGALSRTFDPERFASLAISATEGGIAQTQLYRDAIHLEIVVESLSAVLDGYIRTEISTASS